MSRRPELNTLIISESQNFTQFCVSISISQPGDRKPKVGRGVVLFGLRLRGQFLLLKKYNTNII